MDERERETDRQEEEYENNYLAVDVFTIFHIQINIYLKGTFFNCHISERDLHPRATCFNSIR